jgi:hypothetical protein
MVRRRNADCARESGAKLRLSGTFADCPACKRLSGKIIDPDQIDDLPPADCNREACAILADPYIDFLAGIR